VAAGAAEYFDVDPAAVRIAIVVLALVGGVAVPLYLAAWLLIPEEDRDRSIAEEMLLSWGRPERGCEESTWAPPGEGSRPVGAGSRAVSGDI